MIEKIRNILGTLLLVVCVISVFCEVQVGNLNSIFSTLLWIAFVLYIAIND